MKPSPTAKFELNWASAGAPGAPVAKVSFSLKPQGAARWRGLAAKIGCKVGKKREMRRDYDRFPPESPCRLSYQGSRRPRIVRPSDMPVCGDRRFVIDFDPAETT
jgi:hypothetical protein